MLCDVCVKLGVLTVQKMFAFCINFDAKFRQLFFGTLCWNCHFDTRAERYDVCVWIGVNLNLLFRLYL